MAVCLGQVELEIHRHQEGLPNATPFARFMVSWLQCMGWQQFWCVRLWGGCGGTLKSPEGLPGRCEGVSRHAAARATTRMELSRTSVVCHTMPYHGVL